MADHRIFLSYGRDDGSFVRTVAAELRQRGVDAASVEAREFEPASPLSERLREALRSSSFVVVFMGRSVNSPWMNFEIGAAVGQSKTVLPVFLTRHAREAASPVVRGLRGIDASTLKPEEIADQVIDVIARARVAS